MSNNNHELYLPATERELRSFTHKIDRVAGNFAIDDGWHTGLDLRRTVRLMDDSQRSVRLEAYIDDDGDDVFEVTLSEQTPINNLWDPNVAASLLGKEYKGLNDLEHKTDSTADCNYGYGFIEGYLERERRLKIIRRGRSVLASVIFMMNIMDDKHCYVDCEVGYAPGVFVETVEVLNLEIERLVRFGELLLDAKSFEKKQSEVTRANLIVFMNGLKGAGIAHSRMTPYIRAPLNIPGGDFFSIRDDD